MNGHAVVVGGGIGGLLAAHVLARSFPAVTVLERDRASRISHRLAPESRPGVPQSRCLHSLMAAGVVAFDSIAPDWREEVVNGGAVSYDASADAAVHIGTGWLPRVPSGITTYACSRALLEHALRGSVDRLAGVDLRDGWRVAGLTSDARTNRVTGVRATAPGERNHRVLEADLVVDTSGRTSCLPAWISATSGVEVQELVVETGMQYVSRWYHVSPSRSPDWKLLSIAPSPSSSGRSAMMLRAERNSWGVVLLAPFDDLLPLDDAEFLAFANSVGDGELADALSNATPLSPIYRYGPTDNRLRRYDQVPEWPAGLIALGDAVCALDPYYGLGMTATARGVALLGEWLGKGERAGRAADFQTALAELNAEPWRIATGCEADGRRTSRSIEHLARLYGAAPADPAIAHGLIAVQHLLMTEQTFVERFAA